MKKIDERLYQYSPTSYCGVFMPEKVMKKLVKLTADFEREVRRTLLDNIDDLYSHDWGLAYPDGEQTTVLFANKSDTKRRIDLFKARQPIYCPDVYLGNPYNDEGKLFLKSFGKENESENDRQN